jgi:sugar O-acyltransferase (sialic acid O-acetyltransferase NeuD family)
MSNNDLIILGAGGFAREVRLWAERDGYKVIGFYVNNKSGADIVDGLRVYRDLRPLQGRQFVAAVGDNALREMLVFEATRCGLTPCRAINLSLFSAKDLVAGEGTIICPGTTITTNVRLGKHCIINLNCTIGHDVDVADFVNLAPGVNCSGNVLIEHGVTIGTGAAIREKLFIGERSILGMGSVLVKDLPPHSIWAGNPAKELPCRHSP